jgi:site-specific recombinase XerD
MRLSESLEQFLLNAKANGLRPASVTWYASILNAMIENLGDAQTIAVTPQIMRENIVALRERTSRYKNAPQKPEQDGALSESSIHAHLRAYHRFWAWASDEYNMPNPMKGIKRPKQSKPKPKAIESKDFLTLWYAVEIGEAGIRNKSLLALLADSGARIGGLVGLRVTDCDLIKRRAIVTEKGDKQRLIYFTPFTAKLILYWLSIRSAPSDYIFTNLDNGKPLTISGVHQMLKRLKAKTNVKGRINPHSFRHAFAREYIKNGGDIVTLAELLGHSDINVTASYYAVFDDDELRQFHDDHTQMRILAQMIQESAKDS